MQQAIFGQVESQSMPGKFYTVRRLGTGEIRCECPKFIFSRRGECKHTKAFREHLAGKLTVINRDLGQKVSVS